MNLVIFLMMKESRVVVQLTTSSISLFLIMAKVPRRFKEAYRQKWVLEYSYFSYFDSYSLIFMNQAKLLFSQTL